ncbi:ParB/RepB/Spo0J family partition protein [Thioalkalivibrio sp.]|uniref:ParB/RepB/Spo0J family partition protein n=1 Tax=Thioalkalivibrio sp. TaxID=2093813 RepID=UPI003974D71C
MNEIELSSLDLRYKGYRMRDRAVEARLLASIAERGILTPLEGVDVEQRPWLLNGFKRWRCARRLGLATAPYVSLGEDAALGIVALLRASNDRALSLLEQAGFVDELKRLHGMNLVQIAEVLSRSKAWVSLRLGLLAEMTPTVRGKLFAGAFPVYAYMYSVRPFMRINGTGVEALEPFVTALSGKGLSVREIEHLAQGYFRGPAALREQIASGNVELPLRHLKQAEAHGDGCTPFEQAMLTDIEQALKYMQRVMNKSPDPRLESAAFRAQAQLLLSGVLERGVAFFQSVRQLHDRCGQA